MDIFQNQEDVKKFLNSVMVTMSKQENVLDANSVWPTNKANVLILIARMLDQVDV